jgi:hypothetical protein
VNPGPAVVRIVLTVTSRMMEGGVVLYVARWNEMLIARILRSLFIPAPMLRARCSRD